MHSLRGQQRGAARGWCLYLVAVAGGLFALRPVWDVDIFWHIAAGRWILEEGLFPSTDIFTFIEPPRDWVTFQWGYEVICALLDSAWGLTGIRVFHAFLTSAALLSFAHLAMGWCKQWLTDRRMVIAVATLALAILVALYADRVRARPHVFNLLFWSLALDLLLNGRFSRWRRNGILALVILLWSNLHAGGAFIFLVVLGAWPVAALLVRWLPGDRFATLSESPRDALFLFASALIPALLSPNWARGVWQAYAMLGASEGLIEEWLPFWHYFTIASHALHWFSGVAALGGLALVLIAVKSPGRIPLPGLLVALGATLLPFRSGRFVYLVAFAFVLLGPIILSFLRRISRYTRPALLLLTVLLVGATLDYHIRMQFGSPSNYLAALGNDLDERRFPVEFDETISALAADRPQPLKIFCQPNWGGYLLYRHFPAIRVIADGRGNVSVDLGRRLQFIYKFRHDPTYQKAVADIYHDSGADVLVMQQPVAGDVSALTQWEPVASSRKGMILVRR